MLAPDYASQCAPEAYRHGHQELHSSRHAMHIHVTEVKASVSRRLITHTPAFSCTLITLLIYQLVSYLYPGFFF